MHVSVPHRPVAAPYAWAEGLTTVGITGTNGKTSTTHLTAAAMGLDSLTLAVGTVGYFLGQERLDEPRTAQGFIASLYRLHMAGGRYAAVECTSQALAEGYARRWRFDVGVFTNLSEDHLESHGSWEHYLAAKAQLFVHLGPGRVAVLNAADPASFALDAAIPSDVQRRWYAGPSRGPVLGPTDLAFDRAEFDAHGTLITLEKSPVADAFGGDLEIAFIGPHFAENALAAALAALSVGVEPRHIVAGLRQCVPVPGRFEVVSRSPLAVVDFAHTPDALARTLDCARGLVRGRVLLVLGAGGQRSPQKRAPMGEIAGSRADYVWVTNDNPRGEDPRAIAGMLEAGLHRAAGASWSIILDRRAALEAALEAARTDDIVLVAGKGHERTQEVGDEERPWSDQDVIRQIVGSPEAPAPEGISR